jgi:hypothetical protein
VLVNRICGIQNADFLQRTLPILLQDVPLNIREGMWFHYSGAPPHFSCQVHNLLNKHFPDTWISSGGSIIWPPHSPDLNPLDFSYGYAGHQRNRLWYGSTRSRQPDQSHLTGYGRR